MKKTLESLAEKVKILDKLKEKIRNERHALKVEMLRRRETQLREEIKEAARCLFLEL